MSEPEEYYGSESRCPYCGNEQKDTWELFLDGTADVVNRTCCECERDYEVERTVSVDYTSRPIEE